MKRILSLVLCITVVLSAFGCFATAASAEDGEPETIAPVANGAEPTEPEPTEPEPTEPEPTEPELPHVPQIRVVTEDGNGTTLQKEDGYVNATIEITDTDGSVINESVVFKVRGNGTALASILKKAFTFKFSKKRQLLGLGKGKKWALLANAMDTSLLRTYVTMELAQEMGIPYTSNHRMVELWVDDSFRGLYELIEPVQEGSDRVDIDIESNGGMKDFLLEREKARKEEGVSYINAGGIRFAVNEPEEPTSEQLAYINGVMNEIVNKVKNGTQEEICSVLDVDSFAKFYILNEYVKTSDFDYSSVFFYYKDGKLCAGPPWDYDHSMGSGGDIAAYEEVNSTEGVYAGKVHFYQYLCQYDWFMDEVKRIYALNRDYIAQISTDGGMIDSLAEEYSAEIERNYTETPWKVTRHWSVYQKKPLPTYQENLDFFRNWCLNRFVWLDDYLTEEEQPYIIGDADGDGEITIIDVTKIQRCLAGLLTDEDNMIALRGDSNGDGLDSTDATFIQRFLIGLRVPTRIGESSAPAESE